ncbi:MAG: zinc metallopeptidase [Acidimicrobiales bacterium]|nr:zinc metallopeptidase [Acidimicrobiales bacterium]
MRYKRPTRRSDNIEDRRGARMSTGAKMGAGAGGGGIIAILLALLFGGAFGGGGGAGFDVGSPLDSIGAAPAASGEAPIPPEDDSEAELVDFLSVVLDDNQAFWAEQFDRSGREYTETTLVLFRDATQSGCGAASSATGPFYCSLDKKVYLDLAFFEEMSRRFGAPGDFAQAYVVSHEIAHHVQNELGISSEVIRLSQQNPGDRNELSVRQELQADCLAGVWAHSVYSYGDVDTTGLELTRGDIEEALEAARAVGDDRIQESVTGRIDPEKFTHGTSEQRSEWFTRGLDTGDPEQCDTFSGDI